jgi:hypothetical protein
LLSLALAAYMESMGEGHRDSEYFCIKILKVQALVPGYIKQYKNLVVLRKKCISVPMLQYEPWPAILGIASLKDHLCYII